MSKAQEECRHLLLPSFFPFSLSGSFDVFLFSPSQARAAKKPEGTYPFSVPPFSLSPPP